jgi:hypothetical protein
MHSYAAYGLGIHSTFQLPELPVAACPERDVLIRHGRVGQVGVKAGCRDNRYDIAPQEARICWQGYGAYLVRAGREIVVEPDPNAADSTIRVPLLGMCLALLLVQRGLLVLHASAVSLAGGAVAFVGEKGHGKSTMAATLFGRGHPLITDDVLAIDDSNPTGAALVWPAYPQFKLLPESVVAALGEDPNALSRLAPLYDKLTRGASERFASEPLPLRAVYVLAGGPTPTTRPLSLQDATIQVIANSLAGRYGSFLLRGGDAAAHLRRCAALVRRVRVERLERPLSLSLLPRVAELVEQRQAPLVGASTAELGG